MSYAHSRAHDHAYKAPAPALPYVPPQDPRTPPDVLPRLALSASQLSLCPRTVPIL
jgi:hypothetical protein